MADAALHASHAEVAKRLKRAEGHLRTIIAMIGEGRPCLDLAQQLVDRAGSVTKVESRFVQSAIVPELHRLSKQREQTLGN